MHRQASTEKSADALNLGGNSTRAEAVILGFDGRLITT